MINFCKNNFSSCILQRDDNGDFLTTVVAMDAKQFKSSPKVAQYEEAAVVRELNKAFVGFFNPEVGSHLIKLISGLYFY